MKILSPKKFEKAYDKLEYNVFLCDRNFRGQGLTLYNIFDHGGLCQYIPKILKESKSRDDFRQLLNSELMYYFWSKCEYEYLIDGHKIDVYDQLKGNLDFLCDYIIDNLIRDEEKPTLYCYPKCWVVLTGGNTYVDILSDRQPIYDLGTIRHIGSWPSGKDDETYILEVNTIIESNRKRLDEYLEKV